MRVRGRVQDGGTDPNQSYGSANGSKYLLCGGGFDCILVQNINSVVHERYLGLARSCCHFRRLDVRRTSRVMAVEVWYKRLGARRVAYGRCGVLISGIHHGFCEEVHTGGECCTLKLA